MCQDIDEWKRQLTILEGEWMLIGKYHRERWFQKIMRKTLEELLARYHFVVTVIITLERDIEQVQEMIYKHYRAMEELEDSMNPFAGINFKETPLVQTTMF